VTGSWICARNQFDYVVVDMPSTLVAVDRNRADPMHMSIFAISLELGYALCARTPLRFKRALQSEDLPIEIKLRYCHVIRAPKFTLT